MSPGAGQVIFHVKSETSSVQGAGQNEVATDSPGGGTYHPRHFTENAAFQGLADRFPPEVAANEPNCTD